MPALFRAHLFKHLRGGRIGLAKGVREFAVNSAILFLIGNGDCQNLFFRQVLESFEHGSLRRSELPVENGINGQKKSSSDVPAYRLFLVFLGTRGTRVGVPGTSVLLCKVEVLVFPGYHDAIGLTCQSPYSVCETPRGLRKR